MSPARRRLCWPRSLRGFAAIGAALLLAGCAEPYGDLKAELDLLTRDLRGRAPPLGPAAALPEAAPPLTMERDPFSAHSGRR
jgi:hypothetical protein